MLEELPLRHIFTNKLAINKQSEGNWLNADHYGQRTFEVPFWEY